MTNAPTWAELDLDSLAHNLREIRRVTDPKADIMAVVKANGYGHGAVQVSRVALASGATRLAVARSSEGAELRRAGITAPILVMGYTPPEMIPQVAEYKLEQCVHGIDYAVEVNDRAGGTGIKIPVHIKVDTGMGRLGVLAGSGSAVDQVKKIAAQPNLEAVGIFTHFASADAADKSYALHQLETFVSLLEALSREGLEFQIRHCANSAAIAEMPGSAMNLVRAGISMYGLYPSEEVDMGKIDLKPVMTFKTTVAQVKSVPAGFSISYGCTYITPAPTVIATLPVGYADGYSRLLSSRGEVLVKGRRAPVVGRVCMDQCMIDVGNIEGVAPGDEVVLFGRQGEQLLPVEEVARWIGTINYEVVCMVSGRVPRVYKGTIKG
ncbi:MAG: alanine racemase [Bacillota bacterium]